MSVTASAATPATAAAANHDPIVIDLGKKSRKKIKQLRRGTGTLLSKVNAAVDELKAAGTVSPSAQLVVVVVRQKRDARNGFWPV